MKVTYFGNEYDIPDTTKWLATDEDGDIYAFSGYAVNCNASVKVGLGYWWGQAQPPRMLIGTANIGYDDWLDSLVKIGDW